jgi:hypothetical protein
MVRKSGLPLLGSSGCWWMRAIEATVVEIESVLSIGGAFAQIRVLPTFLSIIISGISEYEMQQKTRG